MAVPTNLSEQILALPKGAGNVQSAGQTFQADPYTGTGRYVIPIDTLPGHAGLTPTLSLTYSTHGGSGIAGQGRTLGLAQIARRTDKGLPAFHDDLDTFTLQGDELLPAGGGSYRLRIDDLFARVRHVRESGSDFWVVTERNGNRIFYGLDPNHRLHDGPGKINVWYVSKKQDPHGNEVLFSYTRDATTHDVRLTSVTWAGCYRVNFAYEKRPDPIYSFRGGFDHQQLHRLAEIAVEVKKTSTGAHHAYRTYTLGYMESACTGRSLLTRVTVTGTHADGSSRERPPLSFGYTTPDLTDRAWHGHTGALPGGSLKDRNLTLVRRYGSGLPGLLETTETGHWLRENLGDGHFGHPRRIESPAQIRSNSVNTLIQRPIGYATGSRVSSGGRPCRRRNLLSTPSPPPTR